MQYKKRKSQITVKQTKRAIDVLYEKMDFYSDSATFIATEICKILKKDDKSQGKRLAEMHKQMMRFNDIAIDCAARLAPYQSAKLQSIEIKKEVTNRFVIQAPMVIKDKSEWLRQVQLHVTPLPITHINTTVGNDDNSIDIPDDDNEDDYEYSHAVEAR